MTPPELRPTYTLLTADRLLDGTGAPPIEPGAVLLQDDRIEIVGRRGEIRAPDGTAALTVDYGDATILPGLVDGHTHLAAPGDGRPGEAVAALGDDLILLQSARNAHILLSTGVTTIRENGNKGRVVFHLREAILQGIAIGPRMSVTGRPLAITGGHLWYFGSEVDGPDACRAEVRQLFKEGADWIKVTSSGGSTLTSDARRPSFRPEELSAIVDEAHRAGRLTAAHCTASAAVENCLDAGIDMLIHCNFNEPDGTINYRADLIDRAVEAGAWINPTLYGWQTEVDGLLEKREKGPLTAAEEATLADLPGQIERNIALTGRMIRQGAKVMAGSDTPWRWGKPAFGLAREIALLIEAGLSPIQAIQAGTSWSADSIGLGEEAGRLIKGRRADVTVVAGDVLTDIRSLERVIDVYLAGAPVSRLPLGGRGEG